MENEIDLTDCFKMVKDGGGYEKCVECACTDFVREKGEIYCGCCGRKFEKEGKK